MRSHFDEAAKTWDMKPDRLDRAQKFAAEIIRLTGNKKYKSAMEFGAGTGTVSFCLTDHFSDIIMIDESNGMVTEIQKKIDTAHASSLKAQQVNLLTEKYSQRHDIIYSLLVLHHIHDIPAILNKFYGILNPGGMLVIGDLVSEDGSFHADLPEFDGHRGFDVDSLGKQLSEAGFKNMRPEIFHRTKKVIRGGDRYYPLFLLSGEKESN